MSVVAKITGQVLGVAMGNDIAPYSQITININALQVAGQQQISTLTQSPSILSSLAIGASVALYLATTPADQSTIEGAVTVVSIDSTV
jgi:hypothetical protein